MCLALVAIDVAADLPLIMIGNRDERYDRPSEPAHWWPEEPELFAGRDLSARGTWFGVNRRGRFGLVTNVREPPPAGVCVSRGRLLSGFLLGSEPPVEYVDRLRAAPDRYAGFNLIVGTREHGFVYASNRAMPFARALGPGIYAVSNALLDTPWPKLVRVRNAVAAWLGDEHRREEDLFAPLLDRETSDAPDGERELIDAGVSRVLTAPFIVGEHYGTRSTSVALVSPAGGVTVIERRFGRGGVPGGETRASFELRRPA